MSRIGKQPITVPQGVSLNVTKEKIIVTGPKGELSEKTIPEISLQIEDNICVVNRQDESKRSKQMHGLYRQLIDNMIIGVTQGFTKILNIIGVGYRAEIKDKILGLNLGFSTPFEYMIPEGISIGVEKQTTITISGIDKQRVGQVAAEIRSIRPPEPYKGKGVKYSDEVIRRKEGKTGKK